MPQDDEPKMIGLDMLLNLGATDRAQAIWERAMTPEAHEFNKRWIAFRHGRGPDPGKYEGPVINFVRARKELEEEEPEWTSLSEDMWEERQREREAQGLEREPHPLGDDYE